MFALYRKGSTHRVDGVDCELIRVELAALDTFRQDGWVDNIEDLDKKPKAKKNENKDSDNH